jgi:hypothetical protein
VDSTILSIRHTVFPRSKLLKPGTLDEEKLMSELKEHLQNVSNDLTVLSKDLLLTMIFTTAPDVKVSDLIETLKAKAADIREEQEKLEGLSKTIPMEGPNQNEWVYYRPTCKFGCEDCIHDPAYIKATYPEWYERLYGGLSPEAAAKCEGGCAACTEEYCRYDDEDK